MKIVRLEAENIKRLKAVEITPEGNLVIIGGENAQGKTSVLDSIEMVLRGEKSIPPVPIHRGADKARIVADLEDIVVKRTFTAAGSYMSVTNKDGTTPKSPQAILDKLVGALSFDPLEFSRLKPPAQVEILKKLAGLDFTALEVKRKADFDERTVVGRQLKTATAQVAGATFHPSAPKDEVSVTDLAGQLGEIERHNAQLLGLKNQQRLASDEVKRAEKAVADAERYAKEADKALAAAEKILRAVEVRVEGFEPKDGAELSKLISDAEDVNRCVRENHKHRCLKAEEKKLADKVASLTAAIEKADATKAEQMAKAKMPVKGLGLDDNGVTFDGLPFEQCSSAQQLRISVAMGVALNPKLKVLLIRDGSLLDKKSMKALAEQAEEADAQVWIERVGSADASAIIIEDGAVKE